MLSPEARPQTEDDKPAGRFVGADVKETTSPDPEPMEAPTPFQKLDDAVPPLSLMPISPPTAELPLTGPVA